jgi:oligopeptide transport system substrate-binding protein
MPMFARSWLWLRLAAVFTLLCFTLPRPLVEAVGQEDQILRVHHAIYPDIVDPQKSSFTNEIDVMALLYEGLTRLDQDQQTVPAAAESWEYNEDATKITFHLREGLTYSDGSPLTAENFRYAAERTCDPVTAGSYQSILFEVVGCAQFAGLGVDEKGAAREYTEEEHDAAKKALGVHALDDRTLQIDLTNPAPYFHTIASLWVFFPVKAEIVAKDPDNWWKSPENHIGNGPFTVTRIDQDQAWTFAASDRYWQGRPKIDGIEYIYIADPAVALAAYQAGDLDILGVGSTLLPEVAADPVLSAEMIEYPIANTIMLGMDLKSEPFSDRKVREAFALAFDRETFCAEIQSGTCVPTLSWIPPGVPGYLETAAYAFDPEAAVQALAESHYGGPDALPAIVLTYISDDPTEADRAEWVAGQYRDILGVELSLNPIDGTSLFALTKDPSTYPQLFMYSGWFQDYPDPQNWLSVYWRCDSTFAIPIGYCNEEFDRLTHLGDTTVDPDERLTSYERAGQVLVDDVPGVFLFNFAGHALIKPNVSGISPTPSEAEWPGSLSSLMTIEKG